MTPTTSFSTKDSPAGCSPPEATPAPRVLCAIHQPNLFPRLNTLAKLFTADQWIVLDDVQFNRRDYQHRARISDPRRPGEHQWLTLPAHLPDGRATLIRDVRLADPTRCKRRTRQMLYERYRRNKHWDVFEPALQHILDLFDTTDRLADITQESTRVMLSALGWNGSIRRSSHYLTRPQRTQRLVDLAVATHATTYLCGTGGARYIDLNLFQRSGIGVIFFHTPAAGVWENGRTESAISALTAYGGQQLAHHIRAAHAQRTTAR